MSVRSGVAVRPEQDLRPQASEHGLVRIGRRVVSLVDDDVLPVVGAEAVGEVAAWKLWMVAKRCVVRSGSLGRRSAARRSCRRGGCGGSWCAPGAGAPRDGRGRGGSAGRAGARSRSRPAWSCRCRWRRRPGCDGGRGLRAPRRAARGSPPGRGRGGGRRGAGVSSWAGGSAACGLEGAFEACRAAPRSTGSIRSNSGSSQRLSKEPRNSLDDVAQVGLAGLHRPFEAAGQRARGQVGAADPDRAEAGLAVEEPGLGVDAAAPAVERDPDLGAVQLRDLADRRGFGGAGVGGGEEPEVAGLVRAPRGCVGVGGSRSR